MTKRSLFLFLFLVSSLSYSLAQKAFINGTVNDSLNKPLVGVSVGVLGKPIGTTTDENGKYELTVPSNEKIKIVFTYTGLEIDSVSVTLATGETRTISRKLRGKIYQIPEAVIEDISFKNENVKSIDPRVVKVIPTPNQSVEDIIKLQPGVSAANELSSTYSVRGGNYDENLVYINDFEVYRPLLVRSGQQEGLSIINPDMVESINFSAGGFDAVYGDKLSSVLDIKYRKPKQFGGAISASLLGASLELENRSKNKKWYYMLGVRQKSNQYLLNTFETKGEYKPSFTDIQLLTGFEFSHKFNIEVFANYSRNRYNLVPENRETNFGTINDAKRFTVFFEGQETDRYETNTGALSLTYKPDTNIKLKLIGSVYRTSEEENFDILGQYFLDQLEADLGKENFGNVAFNLGVGSFLNHARNELEGKIYSAEHKGEIIGERTLFQWGIKGQHEEIVDKLHEWYYNDSSGFSISSFRDSLNPQILLNDVVISRNNLTSNRVTAYVQHTWQITDTNKIIFTTGVRVNYWDLNQQTVYSPRASITYKPSWNKRLNLRAAGGFYYQPPFYRELRDLEGKLYPETKAQKSIHAVVGGDYRFLALGREFKLTTEFFYKQLDNLIPYKVNDIRIRYLPNFTATGYATGVDLRLFGEFVPGADSWLSLSVLQTQEDIKEDFYYRYFNVSGEEIISGFTFDQIKADSVRVEPGYIPRPADQRVNFGLFFQDFLPKFPTYKMQLSLLFGTSLPFGPPGKDRYKDQLRAPTYRRVDIGFSKQLIGDEVKKKPKGKFLKGFNSIWLGIEVFNVLQVSNVASYTWITDVSNARRYAVPNYLTARQLNVRLSTQF
jgi:hypothetical protein